MFEVNVDTGKCDCNGWPINQEISEGQLNNRSKASYIAVCSWEGWVRAQGENVGLGLFHSGRRMRKKNRMVGGSQLAKTYQRMGKQCEAVS